MRKLILGSLFDGSGTFPVAGLVSGIHYVGKRHRYALRVFRAVGNSLLCR